MIWAQTLERPADGLQTSACFFVNIKILEQLNPIAVNVENSRSVAPLCLVRNIKPVLREK